MVKLKKEKESQIVKKDDIDLKTFKSLYYDLNAKPDTRIKIFDESRKISKSDLIDLNRQVIAKLRNHQVVTFMSTVKIALSDKSILEYNYWKEFEDDNLEYPSYVNAIHLSWDFYLKMPDYKLPQRHTLRFKIGSQVKPSDLIEAMFTSESEIELSEVSSKAVCKVDFINSVISVELVNLVDGWYSSLPRSDKKNSIHKFMTSHDEHIRSGTSVSFNILGILLGYLVIKYLLHFNLLGENLVSSFLMGLSMLWALVYIMGFVGEIVGDVIKGMINKIRTKSMFDVTKGDKNRNREINDENNLNIKKIFSDLIIQLIVNLTLLFVNFLIK